MYLNTPVNGQSCVTLNDKAVLMFHSNKIKSVTKVKVEIESLSYEEIRLAAR